MRIGVDATCWTNGRGYGRYARALLSAVLELDAQNQYVFFVDHESEEFPLPASVEVRRVATKVPTVRAAGADSRRSLADLWAVAQAIRKERLDVIYFPAMYSYVPLFTRTPRIVTIHDTIPELFPELVFPTLRSRIFYGAKNKLGIWQSRLLLTVSEYSRRCLVEKLRIPTDRLRVVSEAAEPIFRPLGRTVNGEVAERWGIPTAARCLIFVGGFSPHKNLFMLLDVFRELISQEKHADLHLILVGDHERDSFNSCYGQLQERVQVLGLAGRVLFTGHVEDKDLVILLNRAEALLLPSFSEGFGLPGIEAAACGTPVVATTQSPLPELLGEGVIAVDPADRAGWLGAIERVLGGALLRSRMGKAALAGASRMSWKNSARQLLAAFDEVQRGYHAAA